MSRSYKKNLIKADYFRNKFKEKRFASKAVRRSKESCSGAWYKKVYCSYDICDYKFMYDKAWNEPLWKWKMK